MAILSALKNGTQTGAMPVKLKRYKEIRCLVTGLLLYLVLHVPVEQLLGKLVVDPVLSRIETAWYNDLAFGLLLVMAILPLIRKNAPLRFFGAMPFILLFFVLIGLSYRLSSHPFNWTGFSFYQPFKYADLLLVAAAVYCFGLLRNGRKKETSIAADGFDNDQALGETGVDLLGYTDYAKNLAARIRSSRFDNAFAIGVNAHWGFGKTSFIDLMKRELKGTDYIPIDFNPWNSQTPQAITKDFFNTVEEALRNAYPDLAGQIVNYAKKLVAINDNTVSRTLQSTTGMLFGYDSVDSLHKTINHSLRQIDKKILVYIDDLDRLDKTEVVEVIRLIRNTANFYHTFFIACYDKQYITAALKEHNSSNHQHFLEKIFQIEINLPYFQKDVLRNVLAAKLEKAFGSAYHPEIRLALYGSPVVPMIEITDWLHSIRDVTRLYNNICLNLPPVLGEVEIRDFIRLEILRLRFPMVYELLYSEKGHVFNRETDQGEDSRYYLRVGRDMPAYLKINEADKSEKYLKLYLRDNAERLQVPENKIAEIVDYVQKIFADNKGYRAPIEGFRSVAYPDKFDRYFAYGLFAGSLSNVEFVEAVAMDEPELLGKVDEWIRQGLAIELQKRLMQYHEFTYRAQFEKLIRMIFHLANTPSEGPYYPYVLGFDARNLMDKLSDKKTEKLYREEGGKEALRNFIKEQLTQAPSPYCFVSEFIESVNAKLFDESIFPLVQKELEAISTGYLKAYCDVNDSVDWNAMQLFWHTKQTIYSSSDGRSYTGRKEYPGEAKQIIKDLFRKDLDAFLYMAVDLEMTRQHLAAVGNSLLDIFDTWEAFKSFIEAEEETKWKYLHEFKQFFAVFEEGGFVKYVEFDFKVIPIENKRRKVD